MQQKTYFVSIPAKNITKDMYMYMYFIQASETLHMNRLLQFNEEYNK